MRKLIVALFATLVLGACATVKPEKAAVSYHKKPSVATAASHKPKPAQGKAAPTKTDLALGFLGMGVDAAWNLLPLFINEIIP